MNDEFNEVPATEQGRFSVIWWNVGKGRDAVHAAKNNPDGSYDQDDAEKKPNKQAEGSEFWGEKRKDPIQKPGVVQYNRKSEHTKYKKPYTPLPKTSVNGVNIVDEEEIKRILNDLGLL